MQGRSGEDRHVAEAGERDVDEDEAYRVMRKLAMDRNRKLLEIAQQIIDVSELMS